MGGSDRSLFSEYVHISLFFFPPDRGITRMGWLVMVVSLEMPSGVFQSIFLGGFF